MSVVVAAVFAISLVACAAFVAFALWLKNRALAARVEDLALRLRFTEIRKEAAETHCDELRAVVGQLSSRQPAKLTDEQVRELSAMIAGGRPC